MEPGRSATPVGEADQVKNHWQAILLKRLADFRGDPEKFLELRRQIE
jgi:hypothetical protein